MATQVQWRRGTHAQVLAFTGAVGEIVVDLTQNRAVVQDGVTAGGWPLALQNGDTLTSATLVNPTLQNIAGSSTAQTQNPGDNSTKLATTQYVATALTSVQVTGNLEYMYVNNGGL